MKTIKIVRLHSLVLIIGSLVGGIGYYLQYNYFQLSSVIPATVGIILLAIAAIRLKENTRFALLFIIVLLFGIILTRMSIKFIPQQFQPMRKRIYFPAMALSSIITVAAMVKNYKTRMRLQGK